MESSQNVHKGLLAADMLHRANSYLAGQFSLEMSRAEAQANVTSRTMLINLQNLIMDDLYCLSGLTEAGDQVELSVVRRRKRPEKVRTPKGG